jgi:hypothetical protein
MKRKLIIGALVILAVWVLLRLASSLFAPAFRGGELTKGPLFSYPRYHARLPVLDLGRNGSYSATFSGFPVHDVSIELELPGKTIKDFPVVSSLRSNLSLRLEDSRGRIVCSASGQLQQINNVPHHWVLTGSYDFARLWNSDCIDLKMNPHESYRITVMVEGADNKTSLAVQPLLVGGGIELP